MNYMYNVSVFRRQHGWPRLQSRAPGWHLREVRHEVPRDAVSALSTPPIDTSYDAQVDAEVAWLSQGYVVLAAQVFAFARRQGVHIIRIFIRRFVYTWRTTLFDGVQSRRTTPLKIS